VAGRTIDPSLTFAVPERLSDKSLIISAIWKSCLLYLLCVTRCRINNISSQWAPVCWQKRERVQSHIWM